MGLIFIDGFDHYNTAAAMLLKGWASSSVTSWNTGATLTPYNFGQSIGVGSGQTANYNLASSIGTVYVGMGFYVPSGAASNNCPLLTIIDTATIQCSIYYDLAGTNQIKVYRGNSGGTLLGTSTHTFAKAAWHTIMAKITISNSLPNLGDFQIYIDGVQEINLAATTNTRSSGNNTLNILRLTSNVTNLDIDDMFIADSLVNGMALTDKPRVYAIYPANNGTTNQFVNSNGTSVNNFSYVNSTLQQATTFSADATVSDVDLYTPQTVPYTPTAIWGVQNVAYLNADNAGAKTARILTRSGGTNYESSDCIMASTVAYFKEIREVDPATSSAWTASGIASFQQGVKVQS